jgi:hypothetical protein
MADSSLYNDPSITAAQGAVTAANTDYTNAAATQATLPDMLHSALMSKFTSTSPIPQDLASAQTNFLNSTTSAPLSVLPQNNGGYVWSPNQQADIINKTENAALTPVSFLNMLLGLSTGGIQNVIDATGRANQADVIKKQGAVTNAQSALDNLMKLMQLKDASATDARDYAEKVREFNASQANNVSSSDILSQLSDLLGGGTNNTSTVKTPTEPKPTQKPGQSGIPANINTLYSSPQGQWIFDWSTNDWYPVTD